MNFTAEILEYLRGQYETAAGRRMIPDNNMQSSQAPFYFQKLDDNLIEPMNAEVTNAFKNGDGNELEEKMRALRSSSAMTFNLLGNGPVVIKKGSPLFMEGSYNVKYEKKLSVIKRNPHKANLDAYLKGDNQIIFCEMKMTEWLFNRPGNLRESYLQKELYYHPEIFDAAMECLNNILLPNPTDHGTYYSSLTQYDALQMFKHTLAVYNFAVENHDRIPENIRLVNCVWHLPVKAEVSEKARAEYLSKEAKEHQEFDAFYSSTEQMRKCFAAAGIDFDIVFLPAEVFAEQFVRTPEQKRYQARYFG